MLLGILLGGVYAYTFIWNGGLLRNLPRIIFDAILLYLLLQLTVFFYAQFTVPVNTLKGRLQVTSRLWLHWRHAHGQAIFLKNGREIAREGEAERQGAGLIWVDSASAAVTWSAKGHKQVLGPGIHFTETGQTIGRTFSLHTQTCTLGPGPQDRVFEKPRENDTAEQRKKYGAMQADRTAVSGHTRDGNEVVPNITVVFRLEAQLPAHGRGGSRFGFSARSVEWASRAEGIRADADDEQRRVAWNQLAGLVAIDLWREYLSKFTLDELFSASFAPLPDVPQPGEPPEFVELPSTPLIVKRGLFVRLLRQRNNALEKWLDRRGIGKEAELSRSGEEGSEVVRADGSARRLTALQVIQEMVGRRMTRAAVPILDDCGRIVEGHTLSPEFRTLKERGLAIQDVTISNLRFDPSVERQIIDGWNTGWLTNAEKERQQVEQLERLAAQNGRQRALLEHGMHLGRAIQEDKPSSIGDAARALLKATQFEIVSDQQLYARADKEAATLSELIRWVESGQHD